MKISGMIWRNLMRSFAYTTIFALLIYLINVFNAPDRNAIVATQYLLFLLFGVICGFAQELISIRRLPLLARIGIHYGIVLVSFIVIFSIAGKIDVDVLRIIIFALCFTVIYAIIMATALLILRLAKIYDERFSYLPTGEAKDTTYTNRF